MLTDGDRAILKYVARNRGGFHLAMEWYTGFKPLPWQYGWHHATQSNTTVLGGIACGKSRIAFGSNLVDCLSIPYFNDLNTSVTAKQAEILFDMFMATHDSNERLKRRVADICLRPWPKITFDNFSTWEFRTCGYGARYIRGHEYDRINYDEAGLDFEGESVTVLRGRMRGTRQDGAVRMCRFDIMTSPTDAPWLRDRFDRGWKLSDSDKKDLVNYLSMRVKTRDNTGLTKQQVDLIEADYTDEMIAVELEAEFPDYGLSFFPKRHINACTSHELYDMIYEAVQASTSGYSLSEHPRHGVTKFEMPFRYGRNYVMAGDPGTDDPPKNNAGVVMVCDVSLKPARLVYFDWIAGHGAYNPFLTSFKYALEKYSPSLKYLDTTGPQMAIRELAFERLGIDVDSMNFSKDKEGMLNALSLIITNHEIQWPLVKGIDRQLSSYTRDLDRKNDFPKDITMTAAMLAFAVRYSATIDDTRETHSSSPRRSRR